MPFLSFPQVAAAVNPVPALAREQEGYRWRNDDGSESTATWAAAQDTDISAVATSVYRLRILTNITADPPSEGLKLQFKRSTDSYWQDVRKALP